MLSISNPTIHPGSPQDPPRVYGHRRSAMALGDLVWSMRTKTKDVFFERYIYIYINRLFLMKNPPKTPRQDRELLSVIKIGNHACTMAIRRGQTDCCIYQIAWWSDGLLLRWDFFIVLLFRWHSTSVSWFYCVIFRWASTVVIWFCILLLRGGFFLSEAFPTSSFS